MVDTFYRATLW